MSPRLTYILSGLILVAVSLVYLTQGVSKVGLHEISAWFLQNLPSERADYIKSILMEIRLPRYGKCLLAGAAMAMAGVLTQGLFRNSLAEPSVLGVTAGAGLAACMTFYFGLQMWGLWTLPVASFLGALLLSTLLFTFFKTFAVRGRDSLLLVGFALNILAGAMISLIVSLTLERPHHAPPLLHWIMGDFSYPLDALLPFAFVLVFAAGFYAFRLSARLEVYTLGDEVAQSLAVHPTRLKSEILLAVSLLVGTAVSLVGAIPFVGLIVPHIVRLLRGPRQKSLLLLSAFLGAVFVLLADLCARTLFGTRELQTGVLLAFLGAPFFLFILLWREKGRGL